VLLPFAVPDLRRVVPEVFAERRPIKEVSMAVARLNDGQHLYAVNDLFIGPKSHISARYIIRLNGKEEQHSSSGIIVSTGLGSTGWLKSLLAGAVGVADSLAGAPLRINSESGFDWDANYLRFTVREPFPSKTSSASLVFGTVARHQPLIVISQMPEHGVIFSDGIEDDFLKFNSGTQAVITVADKKGHLVV
jgi:hypothetical protein